MSSGKDELSPCKLPRKEESSDKSATAYILGGKP